MTLALHLAFNILNTIQHRTLTAKPMKSRSLKILLETLPDAAISRAFGHLADLALPPPLQAQLNRTFATLAKIDTQEAELPPEAYPSLNAFFTRALKKGCRTLPTDPKQIACPVDGALGAFGIIEDGLLFQAKGQSYRLHDLIPYPEWSEPFARGFFFNLYLSPRDYHRIHAPLSGHITHMIYSPGRLFPVNGLGIDNIENLFPRNERLTSLLTTDDGRRIAIIKIGATCVGRISVAYSPMLTNQKGAHLPFSQALASPFPVQVGDEIGVFNLGSTVILLIEGQDLEPHPDRHRKEALRLGVPLATLA